MAEAPLPSYGAAAEAHKDALGTLEALQRRASAGSLDDPEALVEAQARVDLAALRVEAARRRLTGRADEAPRRCAAEEATT
jgi:hypothetical protein